LLVTETDGQTKTITFQAFDLLNNASGTASIKVSYLSGSVLVISSATSAYVPGTVTGSSGALLVGASASSQTAVTTHTGSSGALLNTGFSEIATH
jgi:hypothetical protein